MVQSQIFCLKRAKQFWFSHITISAYSILYPFVCTAYSPSGRPPYRAFLCVGRTEPGPCFLPSPFRILRQIGLEQLLHSPKGKGCSFPGPLYRLHKEERPLPYALSPHGSHSNKSQVKSRCKRMTSIYYQQSPERPIGVSSKELILA